jgi:hypothetical protein
MKQTSNNSIFAFLVVSAFFFSCQTDKKSSNTNEKAKDTITTASGLKYFYITKGEGRKVEAGSKVTAMLSLKVNDTVIWTSYSAKDSSFTYIADRGGVIKGYNEMAMLMREGDDVAAFLPGSIAYGEKGSGKVIPPNATLEYDQFKITRVGESRLILADTLFHTLKNDGIKKMKVVYNQITTTKDSVLYHGGKDQLSSLWRKLSSASLYKEAYDAFSFIGKDSDDTTLKYYVISSLEEQGKLKEAISKVDAALKGKLSVAQKEYFIKYKQDLTTELEKK